MRRYTLDEIERTRISFEEKGFERVSERVNNIGFRYYDLPADFNPEFPDFVVSMISAASKGGHLFGISTSVPRSLRPYWVFHEVWEYIEIDPMQSHKCHSALERELAVMPTELISDHVPRRERFFESYIKYARNNRERFDTPDVEELQKSLNRLRRR